MRLQELTWPLLFMLWCLRPRLVLRRRLCAYVGFFLYQPFLFKQLGRWRYRSQSIRGCCSFDITINDLDPLLHILCKMCLWLSLRLSLRLWHIPRLCGWNWRSGDTVAALWPYVALWSCVAVWQCGSVWQPPSLWCSWPPCLDSCHEGSYCCWVLLLISLLLLLLLLLMLMLC